MGLPREPSKQAPSGNSECDSDVANRGFWQAGRQAGSSDIEQTDKFETTDMGGLVNCSSSYCSVFKEVCPSEPQRCLTSYRGQLQETVSHACALHWVNGPMGHEIPAPRHAPHRRCQHFNGSKSGRLVANCLNSIQSIPGISHTWPISKKSWRIFRIRYKVTPVTC